MLKFNLADIKKRIEDQKERANSAKNQKKVKDIHSDPLVKVDRAGDHYFRAVPYIHNEDYLSAPFAERHYHFGIPGNPVVYCPNKNNREPCAVCDFVWSQMKENKGIEDKIKYWRSFLPKKRLFIPGLIRGRENEGVKFFAISTQDDKMSKHHEKLYKYLVHDKLYDFMDPANGFDLCLKYVAYDEAKSKLFNGAKFGFEELELNTLDGRTPISDNPEETWNEIVATMKNIDKDVPRYEVRHSKEMEEVLEKWLSAEDRKDKGQSRYKPVDDKKDDDGSVVVGDEDRPVAVAQTAPVTEKEEPKSDGVVEDRKARARKLLGRG